MSEPFIRRRSSRLASALIALGAASGLVPEPWSGATLAQAAAVVRHGPVARPAHRPAHHPHHRHRNVVVVAPVRPIPAVRPWYWGRVVAGVTIGAVIVASAVAVAPKPPSPDLCWFWTDNTMTSGYWNYCVVPKNQP